MSILETKFFKKTIVCTNFSGANEEIINNKNGIIVDFDRDSFYEALAKLFNDDKLRLDFGNYNFTYKFENIIESFNHFIDS